MLSKKLTVQKSGPSVILEGKTKSLVPFRINEFALKSREISPKRDNGGRNVDMI